MADPGALLARATAKGGGYEARVSAGTVQFTAADIGHALAGRTQDDGRYTPLPDGAVRVLLLKYAAGTDTDRQALLRALLEDSPKRLDWVTQAAYAVLSAAAVREFLGARICVECSGVGYVREGDAVQQCRACDATGRRSLSSAARAAACGLPLETFRRRPAEAYYLSRLAMLYRWETVGLMRVAAKCSPGG